MRIGVPLSVSSQDVLELACRAEEIGVESVWTFDHLIWPASYSTPYPYTESGKPPVPDRVPTHDVWVYLAAVAAATSRIKLGTSVYILPLRDPIVTARAVATLDVVSGGRTILGAGVGWLREEFDIAGIEFGQRGKRTDEITSALRSLWSDDIAEYHGSLIDIPPVIFEPKPPQGADLPIHFSGESGPGMRRAARIGQGWIGLGHTADSARLRVRQLHEMLAHQGRQADGFDITVGAMGAVSVDDVREFAAAGVTRLCVTPWRKGLPWRDTLDQLGTIVDAANEI